MDQLSFTGRTAIITGAGSNPSLGRAHALLLAARGANIVVNDIGHDASGPAWAERVAAEIRAGGGNATADTNTVATEEGANAILATALAAYGAVDILVNNAAISIAAPLDVMRPEDFRRHIEVNLLGPYYLCRAVWPNMRARRYGRIVNTTSSAMTGLAMQSAYATSKGGLWSLTRSLAAEGAALGIKVNALSPGAYTQLAASMMEPDSPLLRHARAHMPAALCSPALAYLCHESCPVTGECIDAMGGAVQRSFIGRTAGITEPDLTIETVASRWDEIIAEAGAETVPIGTHDTASWKLRPYI